MSEVEIAHGFLTAYQELGVAGLFIVMYVCTVLYLIKTLVKSKEESVKDTVTLVTALNETVASLENMTDSLDKLTKQSNEQTKRVDELLLYLKLKDQLKRGGGT